MQLSYYLSHFFAEWEMFQTKDVEKKHFSVQQLFFLLKSYRLCNMKKYRKVGQSTDENIIRLMRFACCIPKSTNKHTHAQTHTNIHTKTHKHTHTRTKTHTHKHTHRHTNTHTDTQTHTQTQTHTHKKTHARSQYARVILTVYRCNSGSRAHHNVTLYVHCLSCLNRMTTLVLVLNCRTYANIILNLCAVVVKISSSRPWIVISNP